MVRTKLPTVTKYAYKQKPEDQTFPIDSLSYSSAAKFTDNQFMFLVNNVNGDVIDTAYSVSSVLGRAVHEALKFYFGGGDVATPANETEAITLGYDMGKSYLEAYSDGFIKYNTQIKNRSDLEEQYALVYHGYVKEFPIKQVKSVVLVEEMLKHHVEVNGRFLPVALKGSADLVFRDHKDRIVLWDHKIVASYSKDDEIDGEKLLQAAFNYFLVYAETGEKPYKIVFGEYKKSKNKDNSKQLVPYEMVYKDMPLMFDLFFRLYGDIIDALMGKQVYVPNLRTMYDKEVSLLAYIHRLDVEEEKSQKLKDSQVSNITDLLKKKLVEEKSLRKYEKTVSENFVSAKTLNYKDMTTEDQIKRKLAEHGIAVEFHSKVKGSSVTLYRYEPSIGVKMARVEQFAKDVEQAVGKTGVRVLAPIPDSELIGFEIPNEKRTFPGKAPEAKDFELAMGIDVMGETYRLDVREAPHILVAGATGSGKSVFVNSLIEQLIGSKSENVAQLVLLDPKMVEFLPYKDLANVSRYEDEILGIDSALHTLVVEMNQRYSKFKEKGVRNLQEYRSKGGKLPYIFVFVDEFGDLIVAKHIEVKTVFTGKVKKNGEEETKTTKRNVSADIRKNILLLGQKARASGIHVILTTQRPSIQIVDGAIKANFPTRVAFRTSSSVDSQVIMDKPGAEKLLGKGDMLLLDVNGLRRLQGYSI